MPADANETRPPRADRLLLLEAAMVLILFALGVYFYAIPGAEPDHVPPWWAGPLLAILFFATVVLETIRRRTRARTELRRVFESSDDRVDGTHR